MLHCERRYLKIKTNVIDYFNSLKERERHCCTEPRKIVSRFSSTKSQEMIS
jgi:hypothetical protein